MIKFPEEFLHFLTQHVTPGKKAAILFSEADLFQDFLPIHQALCSRTENTRIVLLDYYLHPLLQERNLPFTYIFDREPSWRDYANIKNDSEVKAQNGFFIDPEGRDATQIGGRSYGFLLEYETGLFFHKIYKAATDVSVFLKKTEPQAIVLLTREPVPIADIHSSIECNLYQTLIRYLAPRHGIPLYEFSFSRSASVDLCRKLKRQLKTTPIQIPGTQIKLSIPEIAAAGLKTLYILLKNILRRAGSASRARNILFAGPTSANYFGGELVSRLCDRQDLNLLIYRGESTGKRIHNIHSYAKKLLLRFKRKSIADLMRGRFEEFKHSSHAAENLTYQNIPLLEIFQKYFEFIFVKLMVEIHTEIDIINDLLVTENIRLIVAHSELTRNERTIVSLGRRLGIPAINYQHGIEGITNLTPMGFPRIAAHKAVWGVKRKEWLVRNGVDPCSIRIVGCPLRGNPRQSAVPLDVHREGSFLYLTHPGSSLFADQRLSVLDNERILELLLRIMSRFPKKVLVVKTRLMDEQIEVYDRLIRESKLKNVVIEDSHLIPLMQKCDLFFAVYSTAGAEAMLFDKPGIQLNFIHEDRKPFIRPAAPIDIPYAEYGAALDLPSEDPDLLAALIEKIYTSPETRDGLAAGRKKFLRDYCGLGHGDPVENFMNLVNDILEKKQPASAPANPPTTC